MNEAFPVKSTTKRVLLDSEPTDFCLNFYADRIVLFITQTGTVGSVFLVTTARDSEGELDFNIRPLLGRRDQEPLLLCVRRVVAKLSSVQSIDSFVVCFALRERTTSSITSISQITEAVRELHETIKQM